MISEADLKGMTVKEKLRLLDLIWQDISSDEGQIKVPESHIEELNHRAKMVQEGTTEFIDWDRAKKDIEKAIK